jgi:hypothetical protein
MEKIGDFFTAIAERIRTFFDFVSRWYWNLVFHVVKYRNLILAIIILIPTVFMIQYWREITRDPYVNTSSVSNSSLEVVLSHPDRIGVGENNAGELELDFSVTQTFTDSITIDLKSEDDAVKFTPDFFSLTPDGNGYIERQTATVEYKRIQNPEQAFTMVADIQVGQGKPMQVEDTINVNKASSQVAGLSSLIGAVSFFVNLFIQIKKLFSKD